MRCDFRVLFSLLVFSILLLVKVLIFVESVVVVKQGYIEGFEESSGVDVKEVEELGGDTLQKRKVEYIQMNVFWVYYFLFWCFFSVVFRGVDILYWFSVFVRVFRWFRILYWFAFYSISCFFQFLQCYFSVLFFREVLSFFIFVCWFQIYLIVLGVVLSRLIFVINIVYG